MSMVLKQRRLLVKLAKIYLQIRKELELLRKGVKDKNKALMLKDKFVLDCRDNKYFVHKFLAGILGVDAEDLTNILIDSQEYNEFKKQIDRQRKKIFAIIDDCLKEKGFCVVDGFWVNKAFEDFCREKNILHGKPAE
jgi:hypothetical protein